MENLTQNQTDSLASLRIDYMDRKEEEKLIIARHVGDKLKKNFSKELKIITSTYLWAKLNNEKSERIEVYEQIIICLFGGKNEFIEKVSELLSK